MSSTTAALPMYDWPELEAPMDALWAGVASELRALGVAAPARLARDLPYDAAWTRPELVLGQTCGLPMATTLRQLVSVVGTFDHALEACAAGHYHSALMVHAKSDIDTLRDAKGRRLVINNEDSQSGFHSIVGCLPVQDTPFFDSVSVSGAHRQSIAWLLEGRADIAAIDCHSLSLAQRFGPTTEGLRIVGYTDAVPGTPLITAYHDDAVRIGDAVETALGKCDPKVLHQLGIAGLWRSTPRDYAPMADARIASTAQRELRGHFV